MKMYLDFDYSPSYKCLLFYLLLISYVYLLFNKKNGL